jgi:hypothetical protein
METLRDFIIVSNTAVVHEKISASEYYLPVDSLHFKSWMLDDFGYFHKVSSFELYFGIQILGIEFFPAPIYPFPHSLGMM